MSHLLTFAMNLATWPFSPTEVYIINLSQFRFLFSLHSNIFYIAAPGTMKCNETKCFREILVPLWLYYSFTSFHPSPADHGILSSQVFSALWVQISPWLTSTSKLVTSLSNNLISQFPDLFNSNEFDFYSFPSTYFHGHNLELYHFGNLKLTCPTLMWKDVCTKMLIVATLSQIVSVLTLIFLRETLLLQ